MKRMLCVLLSALAFFCLFSGCSKDEENETEKENHLSEEVDPDWPDGSIEDLERFDIDAYDRETYMVPVWNDGGIASAETVFVLAEKDGSVEPIQLLYPAKQIISVRSYGLDIRYEEGKDYKLTADGRLQILTGGSIKAMPYDSFYLDVYDPSSSANMPEIYGTGAQIYSEAIYENGEHRRGMTQWQVCVTYRHSALWSGSVPQNQSVYLKNTSAILNEDDEDALKVACIGDSISQGWTASGYGNVDLAPHMPPYIELFVSQLQAQYPNKQITLKNYSSAGKTSRWPLYEEDGIVNFETMIADAPDLIVIAFGMNDGVSILPEDYGNNIQTLIDRINQECPDSEIVLISSMLPNQEIKANWGDHQPLCNWQPSYKSVLYRITEAGRDKGIGIAFADVLSVYQHIVKTKRFADITSNNTNHPNDYMHRVYAQVLLQTIGCI